MAFLDVTMSDSDFRRQFPLEGDGEQVIGRGPDAALRIAHRSLSRSHCRLVPDHGGWLLEDCGSTNGTLLNGRQLLGARPLQEGDRIAAGVARFVFHLHEVGNPTYATTYPALEVPSAIQRRAEAVEHNAANIETETRIPAATASDEITIDTDDSYIAIDLDEEPGSSLWKDDEHFEEGAHDDSLRPDNDSLWKD